MSNRKHRLINKSRRDATNKRLKEKIKKSVFDLERWRDICFLFARPEDKKSEFYIDAEVILKKEDIDFLEQNNALPKWALRSDDYLEWVKNTTPEIYEQIQKEKQILTCKRNDF